MLTFRCCSLEKDTKAGYSETKGLQRLARILKRLLYLNIIVVGFSLILFFCMVIL